MSKTITPQTREQLKLIYDWIEQNKHKYRKGVTKSTYFSGVVYRPESETEFFPANIDNNHPDYSKFVNKISRFKRSNYLKYEPLEPNGKKVWRVNEEFLPTGTVTYTGVQTPIPIEKPAPTPAPQNVAKVTLEQVKEEARQEIINELKMISVHNATLRVDNTAVVLTKVSLYTCYMAGKALAEDALRQAAIPTESTEEEAIEEIETVEHTGRRHGIWD